jgi:hypothetical protein
LVFYLAVPLVEIPRATGDGYLGSGDLVARNLRIATARDVTRAIDARSAPDETVLSFWPGHLFGSQARAVRGYENDFGPQGVRNAGYSDAEARRYKVASPRRLDELIRRRRVRLIVHGPLGDWTKRRDSQPLIVRSGYRPVATIGLTRLYVRGDPGPLTAVTRCLGRAGLRPAVNPNPPVESTAVEVTLIGGGRAQLFLYPAPAKARAAAADIARFLGRGREAVRQRGAAVIAYLDEPTKADAGRLERCAGGVAQGGGVSDGP